MSNSVLHSTTRELAAGSGLGLLVGVLLGLSTSPNVTNILGVLTVLLGAFFGLAKSGDISETGKGRQWRIAGFGFACTVGALLGLSVRTHGWLSEGPEAEVRRWVAAGATTKQAVGYVAYQRLGVVPEGEKIDKLPPPGMDKPILFVDHYASECTNLAPRRFEQGIERLTAMRNSGGAWKEFAVIASNAPPELQPSLMQAGYLLVCKE